MFFNLIADDNINVAIGALAANDPLATEYNRKSRTAFEGALFYALGRNQEKAARCGYNFSLLFEYYSSDDKLSAFTKQQSLEKQGVWLTVGPDRSDHFIVAAQGAKESVLFSGMASSSEVMKLEYPAVSLAFSNGDTAVELSRAIKHNNYGSTYGIASDKSCKTCTDFSSEFKKVFGIPKFEADVNENNFSVAVLDEMIAKNKPDFLLLPIYSRLAGRILASLRDKYPNLKSAGNDGWGDDKFSFLTRFPIGENQKGLTVRQGAPTEQLIKIFNASSLFFGTDGEEVHLVPTSSLIQVNAITNTVKLLCEKKPKSRVEFFNLMKTRVSHLKAKLPLAVYELKNGALIYGEANGRK